MPTLTIGHVGLIGADLDDVEQLSGASNANGRTLDLAGTALGTTLAETKGLRDEIMAIANHADQLVPITWSGDANLDGFYRINSASFDVAALHDRGFIRFRISAELVGFAGDVVFRSVLSTGVISNDRGLDAAEVEPFHAPPAGHGAYSAVIGSVTRKSEDGELDVYRDITETRPLWSSTPANYLKAAAKVTVDDIVRTGLNIPNNPSDWTLENGLVRVRPRRKSWGYGGSSETPNSNQPKLLPYRGVRYIHNPGGGANNLRLADDADFDRITSDFNVRARVSPQPGQGTSNGGLLARDGTDDIFRLYLDSDVVVVLHVWDAGAVSNEVYTGTYPKLDDGNIHDIKAIWDKDGAGEVSWWHRVNSDEPLDSEVGWTEISAADPITLTSINTGTSDIWVGTYLTNVPLVGDIYRAMAHPGTDSSDDPIVDVDIDAATDLVEPFASFTENTGKTVTINRASSGRVSTVVDQSQWILGLDDNLRAANFEAGLLSPGDGSHTVLAIGRINDDTPAQESRFQSTQNGTGFFYMAVSTPSGDLFGRYNDGTINVQTTGGVSASIDALTRHAFAMKLDRTVDELSLFLDGSEVGTPADASTLGSVPNQDIINIGNSAPGNPQVWEGSFMVALIFTDALTDAELNELGSWDGTVANEPTWLRTHASLAHYINADDPDQQAAYMGDNQLINLADNALTGGVLANEVGSIEVEHYNGTDWLSKIWELQTPSGTELPPWEFVTVVRNDPEEAIVRLEASVAGGGRNTLDLSLRRGARHVSGYLTIPASGTIKVVRGVTEAGAGFTPTGATGAVGVDAAADDDYGNRYIVGVPVSHTPDTVEGGIEKGSITSLGFFIGSEIAGARAQSGDRTDDVALQALALTADATRSLRR